MLARPKVKVLSLALAVVWMATQCMAFQATPSPEAKQRYAQARRLLALGEKDKAIEELKAVIQLSPQFIEAQRDYLDNQRDKAESFIEQYEGYVKQNPDSAVYHYLLGKVYSNANKRDKSDAEFKKALELDPKSGWAMLAMSSVATRAGDSARSIELLKGVGENAGDSVALRLAVANGLLSKKLYDEPLKQAEHILRIDPETFDAWTIRWQAKMSLSFGADETRAEVLREIQDLEAKHGKDIRALLVARSGYQMLDDEKGADRAKKAILALDPKYFERQPYSFFMGSATGKAIRLTGPSARMFTETFSMKDEAQKLEAYKKLETMLEDADAKLYALYPAMIRSYVALKDADNAARVLDLIVKGNAEPRELADSRLTVARAYYNSKTKLDVALDLVRQAVEQFRQPVPTKDGAELPEYVKENAKKQLADALQLNGQILLEKGNGEQAIASLNESVKLLEKEENLYDLGRAYNDVGKKDEAIDALSRAYAYEGKRQQEAKASLEKIYGSRAGATPLDKFLGEAVDRQRTMVREASIAKAVREMAKTEAKDAPTFTLATLAGQKVKLQDLRGKVLLLNFWATW